MPQHKKEVNVDKFKELAAQGLNCKQIAAKFDVNSHDFGFKMKELLGIYPSIYIARLKNGKT